MVTTDVDLQLTQQLIEAGKLLSEPPVLVEELLHLLDQTEKLLSYVDQTPNQSLQEALAPATKALVSETLRKHPNDDVRVAVAACIVEMTRITAPDAPYNDEEMKSIFELIVSTFENLSDDASRSYVKRASILDTVAKVRSCVIMLDIECDHLVVEMFKHFFKSVRDHLSDAMFGSMVHIMALVLVESEDISLDLLKPILASVKNNSEGVLPIARKLGEAVLQKSADKVKPYLSIALSKLGDRLDDYSQVLTSICEATEVQAEPQTGENKSANEPVEEASPKADESKLTTASTDNKAQKVVIKTAEVPTETEAIENGSKGTENEKALTDKTDEDSSEKQVEVTENREPKVTIEENTIKEYKIDSVEPSDSTHCEKQAIDIRVSDPKPVETEVVIPPSESDTLPAESVKKVDLSTTENSGAEPRKRNTPCKVRSKRSTRPNNKTLTDVMLTKVPEVMTDSDVKSPKRARKKTIFADEEKSKPLAAKTATVEEGKLIDSDAKRLKTPTKKRLGGGDSVTKKKPKVLPKKPEGGDADTKKLKKEKADDKKDAETNESDSDNKPLIQSVGNKEKKKVLTNKPKPSEETANKDKGSDADTDSDNKPLNHSVKKGKGSSSAIVNKSSKKITDEKKKASAKKVEAKPEVDAMEISPKSAVKGKSETTSKRKRSVGKDNVSEKKNIMYDSSLVGQKVKVWWPMDKTYYEGAIESFDSTKKKHKVLYLDGQSEVLNLRREKWEAIQEYSEQEKADEAQTTTEDIPEAPKKKAKTSASKEKLKSLFKPGKRGLATKACVKNKGDENSENKSDETETKEAASVEKDGGNSVKETATSVEKDGANSVKETESNEVEKTKEGEKSKEGEEEISKTAPDSKAEAPKIVYKSRRKNPENKVVKESKGDVEKEAEKSNKIVESKSGKKGKKN